MNKNIIALAVAAAVLTVPVIASAQVTLFGQFKYEVGAVENLAGDRGLVHSSAGTRLGVHGSEDLGGGISAIFRFQNGFNQANTALTSTSFNLDEEAWVGLQGGFGRVLLGRSDTAFKLAHIPFRAFTDTLADLNSRPASLGRAEGVHYTTPNFGGVTLGATIEPNGNETDAYYALNAIYRAGPLFVAAAYETAPSAADGGLYQGGGKQIALDSDNWQLGASYNFGAGTVGLLYQMLENPSFDTDVWTLPVTYKVTPQIGLRAAVQFRDPDVGDDSTNYALGAQYNFSNRTELFANVWADDRVLVTPNGGVGGGSSDDTHFGLGLRHSF
jgi:predicted porin